MLVRIFCHNDPIVYDYPDGKRDSSDRHNVGCDSKSNQQYEACSYRYRNLDNNAYRAAPVEDEQDDDRGYYNHYPDEHRLHRRYGLLYSITSLIDDIKRNSFR